MANDLDLGKKVGPLPLGAWIAVVLGGLGVAWYINRTSGGGSSEPIPETGVGAEPGVGTGGGQFIYDPPTNSPTNPNGHETNDQWGRAAILHLLSEGKDPGTSTAAVTKYLAELPLSPAENALISLAIAKLGPPPQLPSTPTPEPPPTTTPEPGLPAAPTGLRTWGNGSSRLTVSLQWNAVPGATGGYRVYRKGVATTIGHSADTKITVGGLRPNTSYTFHVRALNSKLKYGPASATITVKTKK